MKVAILDDYHDTLRSLDCFKKLSGHEIKIWSDHVQDVDALAQRLRDAEAVVLIRARRCFIGWTSSSLLVSAASTPISMSTVARSSALSFRPASTRALRPTPRPN